MLSTQPQCGKAGSLAQKMLSLCANAVALSCMWGLIGLSIVFFCRIDTNTAIEIGFPNIKLPAVLILAQTF